MDIDSKMQSLGFYESKLRDLTGPLSSDLRHLPYSTQQSVLGHLKAAWRELNEAIDTFNTKEVMFSNFKTLFDAVHVLTERLDAIEKKPEPAIAGVDVQDDLDGNCVCAVSVHPIDPKTDEDEVVNAYAEALLAERQYEFEIQSGSRKPCERVKRLLRADRLRTQADVLRVKLGDWAA